MKSLGNLLKRAQKKFESDTRNFFFLLSKTRFPTGKNSKSRTEVRDLKNWNRGSACQSQATSYKMLAQQTTYSTARPTERSVI